MTSNEHLTDETAMDLVSGRLTPSQEELASAHLADCAGCTERLAFWRRAGEAATASHTFEPPQSAIRRAVALFDPALLPVPAWKRLVASLIFDSRRETALAGVRDAGASFQLLAQIEDFEIDLLCEPEGSAWRITGQIVAAEPFVGGTARLLGPSVTEVDLSDAGEFVFGRVPAGDASLEVETALGIITLAPFHLGGRGD